MVPAEQLTVYYQLFQECVRRETLRINSLTVIRLGSDTGCMAASTRHAVEYYYTGLAQVFASCYNEG